MEELARRFRRGAEHRQGLRYPQELRQLAVKYATQASAQGTSQREIAESLGLSEPTLVRWQQGDGAAGPAPLHEVVVVERAHASHPVLVMPSGARIEGLSVADLVMVLEALG
jgi:transposase-like protein